MLSRADAAAIMRAWIDAQEARAAGGSTVPSDIPPNNTHKPEPPSPTPTPEPEPKPIWDPEPGVPQPDDQPPPIVDPAIPTAPKPIVTMQRCRLLQ